jgi:hypothetical protein
VEAKKSGVYDFNADYRDFAYFNFLPSYADPLLSQGIVLDEQSFDTRRKIAALSLDIRPGHWWTPTWDGITTRVPAPARRFLSATATITRFRTPCAIPPSCIAPASNSKSRFHVTLEEGGTFSRATRACIRTPGSVNYGNFSAPDVGANSGFDQLAGRLRNWRIQRLQQSSADGQSHHLAGYLRPVLYSQPNSNVHYQQTDAGNLYLQSQILFYSSEQEFANAASEQPHTSGSFGAEIRPLKRMRIVESWLTDRLHDAGSSASTQTLMPAGTSSRSVRCSPRRWLPTTTRRRSTSS